MYRRFSALNCFCASARLFSGKLPSAMLNTFEYEESKNNKKAINHQYNCKKEEGKSGYKNSEKNVNKHTPGRKKKEKTMKILKNKNKEET